MNKYKYSAAAIIVIFLTTLSSFLPVFAIDYLQPGDFEEESWFKTTYTNLANPFQFFRSGPEDMHAVEQ